MTYFNLIHYLLCSNWFVFDFLRASDTFHSFRRNGSNVDFVLFSAKSVMCGVSLSVSLYLLRSNCFLLSLWVSCCCFFVVTFRPKPPMHSCGTEFMMILATNGRRCRALSNPVFLYSSANNLIKMSVARIIHLSNWIRVCARVLCNCIGNVRTDFDVCIVMRHVMVITSFLNCYRVTYVCLCVFANVRLTRYMCRVHSVFLMRISISLIFCN